MTDTIEIELPICDTNNLSYASCNWSKDEAKVPSEKQSETEKHSTATNWWAVLTAVIAVSALGVAVVTGVVLKSECSCDETSQSYVNVTLELQEITTQLQADILLLNASSKALAEKITTLEEQLLFERAERAKLQSYLNVSLEIQESLHADNVILKAKSTAVTEDVNNLTESLQLEKSKIARLQNINSQLQEVTAQLHANNTFLRQLTSSTGTLRPAAHIYGSNSNIAVPRQSGYIFEWSITTLGSFLDKGITYDASGRYLRVPKGGLYYIYAQITCDPDNDGRCGFRIQVNEVPISYHDIDQTDTDSDILDDQTMQAGLLRKLDAGDKLRVVAVAKDGVEAKYIPSTSYLGAFSLS